MGDEERQMSLVATFDDLVREFNTLINTRWEDSFLRFLRNQKECMKAWHRAEARSADLERELHRFREEKRVLEATTVNTQYVNDLRFLARGLVEQLKNELRILREENERLRRGLSQIQAFVHDTGTDLNKQRIQENLDTILDDVGADNRRRYENSRGSILTLSDCSDYEPFSETKMSRSRVSGDGRRKSGGNRKRGSVPVPVPDSTDDNYTDGDECVAKRTRRSARRSLERGFVDPERSTSAKVTLTVLPNNQVHATAELAHDGQTVDAIETRTTTRRSATRRAPSPPLVEPSAPPASESGDENHSPNLMGRGGSPALSTPDCFFTPERTGTPTIVKGNSVSKIVQRQHKWVSKTVTSREECPPCGKRQRFYKVSFRCMNCHATCHPECKNKVPLPCIPISSTPQKNAASKTVADFAPSTGQMVPALVVHVVNEIEARGLTERGLYRVPGSESEIKKLREKFFKQKGTPNLTRVDVATLASFLKDFFRCTLTEPLITRSAGRDLLSALENTDYEISLTEMEDAVKRMPRANRDTLAFLMIHLQLVSQSPETTMGVSNLAKCIAPSLIRDSVKILDNRGEEDIASTMTAQARILERLLCLDHNLWTNLLRQSEEEQLYRSNSRLNTPVTPPGFPPAVYYC